MDTFHLTRRTTSTTTIVTYGIVAHAVLLMSVFDVYFRSPILLGLEPVSPRHRAPARRLVLFLADGLRADKCFNATIDGEYAAPFLRSIAESSSKSAWGVSHTRVPTESRPGTVALVSGHYEDVSAITKGWKENPVHFDSVFNESRRSFCWGSPDTLSMFGSTGAHVRLDGYDQELVDFGARHPSELDTWVLDRFERYLGDAARNDTLAGQLDQDRTVFFLHLLASDITGHTRKPQSPEYADAIAVVDGIVNRTVALVDEYFRGDGLTAFVFTADHGMTDWGSHGSSDKDETETPFLAWGAGIGGGEAASDHLGRHYGLSRMRRDVKQADVAPLMAVLIGIPIPVNSVGIVPHEILDCDSIDGRDDWCAEALVANARQLAAQFDRHWQLKDTSFLFRPFDRLSRSQLRTELESLSTDTSLTDVRRLMDTILIGIRYFETYDRLSLCVCVTCGFLGWMCFVLTHLMSDDIGGGTRKMTWMGTAAVVVAALVMLCVCRLQNEPLSYYAYRLFPLVTWTLAARQGCGRVLSRSIRWDRTAVVRLLAVALGLELLVVAFFVRQALAFGVILVGFYPRLRRSWTPMDVAWLVVCTLMSTFALWPPIAGTGVNHALVALAAVAGLVIAGGAAVKFRSSLFDPCFESGRKETIVVGVQLALLVAVFVHRCCLVMVTSPDDHHGMIIRATSWTLLVACNLAPMFGESVSVVARLFGLSLSLATSYLLLSYAYESLYCVTFLVLLSLWRTMERRCDRLQSSRLTWDVVRRAYFSLFFAELAFFGLGNSSNVNSFSLDTVFPFVTRFRPYTMGALLLAKVLIPFLAVACHVPTTSGRPSQLYVVLLLCDLMAVQFFFMVRDEGSWLEIGLGLGRFVIAIVTTGAFVVLHLLADLMMTVTFRWPRSKTHFQ